MVSFEIFVKAMPPSLSELKVLPGFCFAFKIPDDVAASSIYLMKMKNKNIYPIMPANRKAEFEIAPFFPIEARLSILFLTLFDFVS
jgi:hypothetical protein